MRWLAFTACLVATPVAASDDAAEAEAALLALEGDVAYGEYLAAECTGCHQQSGANDGIPSITILDDEGFRYAMLDYRTGLREHQVMNMIANRLGDEEIAALAAYFATLQEEGAENREDDL